MASYVLLWPENIVAHVYVGKFNNYVVNKLVTFEATTCNFTNQRFHKIIKWLAINFIFSEETRNHSNVDNDYIFAIQMGVTTITGITFRRIGL